MEIVRIGIVGIGSMGSSHLTHLMAGKVQNAKVTAVCDINLKRLEWVKENFSKEVERFETIEALINAQVADALIIATPHYDHPIQGILGLKSGLHVLVEKPIGVYTKGVMELNQVAIETNQVFTIMYNQRTNPLYQKVKSLIDLGELGEIIRVNWVITNWFRSQTYYNSGGWRATWAGEGGGVLLNQCPHQIDLIQWLCGLPKRVRAFADYGKYHEIEVEDDVTAFFQYENGATGTFITSTGEAPGTNRLEISGDKGKLTVENGKLIFQENEIGLKEFTANSPEAFKQPPCITREIPTEGVETGHVGIMQNFVNGILFNEAQIAPGIEGINGLSLSNAIHLSTWTDAWVDLPIDHDLFYEQLQKKIEESRFVKITKEQVFDVKGSH